MKINFIINESDNDSRTDANILSFMFKKIKDKVDIKLIYNPYKTKDIYMKKFIKCIGHK